MGFNYIGGEAIIIDCTTSKDYSNYNHVIILVITRLLLGNDKVITR